MTRKILMAAGVLMTVIRLAAAGGDYSAVQRRLGLSEEEGSVVDASGSWPQMILIQDVHRHPEAQQHIRAMILFGLSHWGAKEIFLEGAWANGNTEDYAFLGLEDPAAYRSNVAAYHDVEKIRDAALQEIETAQFFQNTFDAGEAPPWAQLKRLVQLRMKPAEYAEYQKHPFRPGTGSALERAVISAEHFYEIAGRRSSIFLANAERLHRSGPQMLVIGGFHTAGMTETLRQKGISYVVLSPKITQGGYETLYSEGMHQTISALRLH